MSIFRKKTGNIDYFDQIVIGGYGFDAEITVRPPEESGDPSAIHGGRIIYFQMTCSDDVVALFNDGWWYNLPTEAPFSHDEFAETAKMAMDILIRKWSYPERIKGDKIEITNVF